MDTLTLNSINNSWMDSEKERLLTPSWPRRARFPGRKSNMKIQVVICLILVVLSLTFGLGAVWYWAIFGMSKDIGTACTFTAGVLLVITIPIAISTVEGSLDGN